MHLFERTVGGQYRAPVQVGGLDDPAVAAVSTTRRFTKRSKNWNARTRRATSSTMPPCWRAKPRRCFRQRQQQFRRATFARRFSETFARRPNPRVMAGIGNRAGKSRVLRVHFQDPGEHGPETPRPHRVRPRLLRQIRARHDGASFALGKKVRLSSSHKLFGNERETVDEAYPGDVIGLVGHDSFGIGDTLTTDPKFSTRKSRASRPRPSAICTIRTRPSSSNSARAWSN
jgi:peptide chain release factor 3